VSDITRARELAVEILGPPVTQLDRIVLAHQPVVSAFETCHVWLDGQPVWVGIIDRDVDTWRVERLTSEIEALEIRFTPIEQGLHYR
jgi:hypothetical protein